MVLVAAGDGDPEFLSNGSGVSEYLMNAEIYNPVTGTWTTTPDMSTPRRLHTATLLPNGTVLVAGGVDSSDDPLASAEIYDPVAGTWTLTGNITTAREQPTAALLSNGTVLVAGGDSTLGTDGLHVGTAEIFDPSIGTFARTGNMTAPRGAATATPLANGSVLVAGGFSSDSPAGLASAELYFQ
jgi:hypothetical protein